MGTKTVKPRISVSADDLAKRIADRVLPGLSERSFSSGSVGFSAIDKVMVAEGERYQVSIQAVLIGSKDVKAA